MNKLQSSIGQVNQAISHNQQAENQTQLAQWEAWVVANQNLTAQILVECNGVPLDVDTILRESRNMLEERYASYR